MNLNRFCYLLLALAAAGSLFTQHPFVMWFLLVNILTLVVYGGDKMAARKAWRRVPESTLLAFGFVGGWPGAIAGQQLFRHKTQKQPFKTYFIISVVLSVAVMAAAYYFYPFASY
jgi:Predicted membrane protein